MKKNISELFTTLGLLKEKINNKNKISHINEREIKKSFRFIKKTTSIAGGLRVRRLCTLILQKIL